MDLKKIVSLYLLLLLPGIVYGQIHIPMGSDFHYYKGKDAFWLSGLWMHPTHDFSSWQSGPAPFRYGDGEGGTLVDDMQGSYSSLYLRSTFEVQNADRLDTVFFHVDFDDGFVLWINGKEALAVNAPTEREYDGLATGLRESGHVEGHILQNLLLFEGLNHIAVQVFNQSLASTDLYFDASLEARLKLPDMVDTLGLDFSHPAGFYQEPFELEVSTPNPSWKIRYSLDGSDPRDTIRGRVAGDTLRLLIDPESDQGRASTPAVVLRASVWEEGRRAALPETRTYIFAEKVLLQDHPGGDWPTGPVNEQVIDLGMDPRITQSPAYGDRMIPSLLSLPSVSVVTGTDNLFHPGNGIYTHATDHGPLWERFCSVELIHPDGDTGFSVNAGLRIRGGWSRNPQFAKHGFRLFFRGEYGQEKLEFPIFGDEGVDRFDKIDLRTAQNYAWSNGGNAHSFLRDIFSRDSQRDMGRAYTRSRYYHLYLDGMYWGVYQSQERAEARYAESYFGGDHGDYDVIKVNTQSRPYSLEATDGSLDSWKELYIDCLAGFSDPEDFFALEGKNALGQPVRGGRVLVEIENLIDYMLVIFYTGNFDAPVSSYMDNKGGNNYYAVYNREDPSSGYRFFAHDSEHSMFDRPTGKGFGLSEDRVNLADRTDGLKMFVGSFEKFHPQWLHHKLCSSEEYRLRFMDRAHQHMGPGGILSPEKNLDRLNARAMEVEASQVAEAARWGDARNASYYFHPDEHWQAEVSRIRQNYLPYRGDIVKGQLRKAGLYSELLPPELRSGEELVNGRVLESEGELSVELRNTGTGGDIFYTMNGRDPRRPGGALDSTALQASSVGHKLQLPGSAVLKARILAGDQWSPLASLELIAAESDYGSLALTELHYDPRDVLLESGDSLKARNLEFIEFKNIGEQALHLGELVLDSGIHYEFPRGELLPPGQFLVLASDPVSFYRLYGLKASGSFRRQLSNKGEYILLRTREGKTLMAFSWSEGGNWPPESDSLGHSLVSVERDPRGSPSVPSYWRASLNEHGSPFADDPELPSDTTALPEYPSSSLQLYPNPTSGLLHVRLRNVDPSGRSMLQIFDLRGRKVHERSIREQAELQLREIGLEQGVYILRITCGDQRLSRKLIIR